MNHPTQNNTNTPIRIVDNDLQSSLTTTSWEVLCDDLHSNIDLLRQLEQSMQLQDNDDDDDGWSQADDNNDNNNNKNGRQRINEKNSMHQKPKNGEQTPEAVSPEQSMWKIRFLRLVRCYIVTFSERIYLQMKVSYQ